MNEVAAALVMGVAAGLAVALPVGPVALLVVQEGLPADFASRPVPPSGLRRSTPSTRWPRRRPAGESRACSTGTPWWSAW
jgi:hypothetical protein